MAQRSGSPATDAMVEFFELKSENSTLRPVVHDLTAAKISSIKTAPYIPVYNLYHFPIYSPSYEQHIYRLHGC